MQLSTVSTPRWAKQRREIRVVQLVVDDEPDIDRKRRSLVVDGDGMAVAAGPEFAIVDGDRIMLRQGPGRGIAGNSRSDNRDPYFVPLRGTASYAGAVPGVSNQPQAGFSRGEVDSDRQNRGKTL
jgi:hypothetical protein